jgi:hypothetical protein
MEHTKQWRDAIRTFVQVVTEFNQTSQEFLQPTLITRTVIGTVQGGSDVDQSKATKLGRVVQVSVFEKVRRIIVEGHDVQIETTVV